MNIPNITAGILILLCGRKIFWLFVACLGFVGGFNYATLFFGPQPEYILFGIALIIGIGCGLFAVFLQEFAVSLAGFLAGGYVTLHILHITGIDPGRFLWIVCLAGGMTGTFLFVLSFDWALILISTLIGSILLIEPLSKAAAMDSNLTRWTFAALMVFGVSVQARLAGDKENRQRRFR